MNIAFPFPLPDDPNKWDGWSKYKSPNFYERLCLDPRQHPGSEAIEKHCRELLLWWQKKLPLKNQPNNPLSQLLRPGLEESSRYLAEARNGLLDPRQRQQVDETLAVQAHEQAVAEFHKYLTFATGDGILTLEEETNLLRFGKDHHLNEEQMLGYIAVELQESGAQRARSAEEAPGNAVRPRAARARRQALEPKEEFLRMLRLTGLDSEGMTDDTRDAFVNMAENLGIDPGEAEDLVDLFLEEADKTLNATAPAAPPRPAASAPASHPARPAPAPIAPAHTAPAAPIPAAPAPAKPAAAVVSRERLANFVNSQGAPMLFVPAGEFTMGSDASDAAPNEQPLTHVTLSRFFMSRCAITNAEFEQFDPGHARKRAPGAGDRHPVLYVSSLEALKFCQWLTTRERKKYRLPTEAEWEYAARGGDARKFPWGDYARRGDLANFADKNTVFAWSDREIDDGYPESSPVGAFPLGASPFGLMDMAGNVWEWCLDYSEAYRGAPKLNPRGANAGAKRVYRGGSWKSRFHSLRTTGRGSNAPNYSCNDLGFRIVCESE